MRPCSAMAVRCLSRCVSVVPGAAAVIRGGTMTAAFGRRSATASYTAWPSYALSAVIDATSAPIWSMRSGNSEMSPTSSGGNSTATIRAYRHRHPDAACANADGIGCRVSDRAICPRRRSTDGCCRPADAVAPRGGFASAKSPRRHLGGSVWYNLGWRCRS
jgi:hypothetical protein